MKSANELLAANGRHEDWVPLLDMAAREVFELMLASHLTESATAEDAGLDITSMVGLAGQLCGILSVRCSAKAAALMASKMLGMELDKVGPEVADAIGEVCNMVAGNFKNKVSGLAEGCMLSPPTVITGSDYSLHSLADSPLETRLLFENMPIVISLQTYG
ncbi:MAG TPA: chemotaxis protein CheX [Terriglobales bacterium]|jgi:chemotaxis protein CheX|nr:chemotaxis protein CheX [Terriglobales bacterium]